MTLAAITILGLGPGSYDDLTLQARHVLAQAAQRQQTVYFRTLIHPTVAPLQKAIPSLHISSFDHLYDESADWTTLYQKIAEEVCSRAAKQPIIYAVPGHPLIGESSVQLVMNMAKERSLQTSIVAGVSFLEPVCTAVGLDPFDAGTQILDATILASLSPDEIAGKVIPTIPLLVTQVYNRRLASAVKLALSECYPDEWSVKLVRAAGVTENANNDHINDYRDETTNSDEKMGEDEGVIHQAHAQDGSGEKVLNMPLYELDRNNFANHLSTLFVPPIEPLQPLRLPETLRYITMRLRRDPDGCPWDREQTHKSLTRYMLEESYEVVEAIEENDMEHLSEELGDILLQVYLHSEIARQEGNFTLGDVYEHVNAKLIRRHPHVFGDVEVEGAGQVVQNWETIKRQERIKAGKDVQNESVLDRVPLASPSLTVSQEYQKRARKTGFDYSMVENVYKKLDEELNELREATTPEHQFEEIGDLLYVVALIALWHNVDAEAALRQANRKFHQRFQAMEHELREQDRTFNSVGRDEWIELWKQAKQTVGAQ